MEMEEDPHICVGVCMSDPDSGYCLGCGRPPLATPEVVVEVVPVPAAGQEPASDNSDSPT